MEYDDEFLNRLLSGPAVHEPSAEERLKRIERLRREELLAGRLAEEEAARVIELRRFRRRHRMRNGRRWLLFLAALAAFGGILAYADRRPAASGFAPSPAGPPPGVDSRPEPLGFEPNVEGLSGPYAFSATHTDTGGPVAWDPCRPIRWVVNPAGAPEGDLELLHLAVAEIEAASGFVFEFAGETDEPYERERRAFQPGRYGRRWAPLLVAWGTEDTHPELAGDVAGLGGPISVASPSGRRVHVSGAVLLDTDSVSPSRRAAAEAAGGRIVEPPPEHRKAVMLHELAHALGLDHVDDPTQLMHPQTNDQLTFAAGDLLGLAALRGAACVPDV